MRDFRWDEVKSRRLKMTRGLSFEEILLHRLVKAMEHPNRPQQRILLFEVRGYIWAVPCVVRQDVFFLKTLYPCRKYTKLFLKGGSDEAT